MPGLRLFLAIVLIGLMSGAVPARAILLQDSEFFRQGGTLGPEQPVSDAVTGARAAPSRSLEPPLASGRGTAVSGDPCTRQPGWLVRSGSGVLSCSVIADLFIPAAEDGRTAGDHRAVQGSLLALLILGLAALAFAARRPVWIARLMR